MFTSPEEVVDRSSKEMTRFSELTNKSPLNASQRVFQERLPNPEDIECFGPDQSPKWRKLLRSYSRPFRSKSVFCKSLRSFLPVLNWLPKYRWREQLFGDVMAGIIIGVFNITQGLAYGLLAGLPAVNGLYATFVGALIFPFLTSWDHGSVGPFAIAAVMCRAAQESVLAEYEDKNNTVAGVSYPEGLNAEVIVGTLTFLVGVACLIFAILRLQFFAEYFSGSLVSGFITAGAVQVLSIQLNVILGLPKPLARGFGSMFKNIGEILIHLPEANLAEIVLFICCTLFLCACKFVAQPQLTKRRTGKGFIVPYELILVILSSLACYFMGIVERYGVSVVGSVPTGLPTPHLPRLALAPRLGGDAFAIAIVMIVVHLSLARMFCARKRYKVDYNQELYAYGICMSAAGLLPVFPPSEGLGRPFIIDECGGSSPVHSLVSAAMVLVVLLFVGPLFYWLPLSALSSIVVMALRSLFTGFFELPKLWRISRWDFGIWVVTFAATTITDVISGLALGILFELFSVTARTQWPHWTARFDQETSQNHICVFKLESMLLFTNADFFKKHVEKCYLRLLKPISQTIQLVFVFDCSAITDMDLIGGKKMAEVVCELREKGFVVRFACAAPHLIQTLRKLDASIDDSHVSANVTEVYLDGNRRGKG